MPRVTGGFSGTGLRRARWREAHDIGEGLLETEAEPGVRHRAVAPEITPTLPRSERRVGGPVLPVDAALRDALIQHREPLLALAADDDLAGSTERACPSS